jgi:hypothetical protein
MVLLTHNFNGKNSFLSIFLKRKYRWLISSLNLQEKKIILQYRVKTVNWSLLWILKCNLFLENALIFLNLVFQVHPDQYFNDMSTSM